MSDVLSAEGGFCRANRFRDPQQIKFWKMSTRTHAGIVEFMIFEGTEMSNPKTQKKHMIVETIPGVHWPVRLLADSGGPTLPAYQLVHMRLRCHFA